jgi:hypothetical protein
LLGFPPPLAPPVVALTPLCELGCVDIDPAPTAPGVFLGHAFTPQFCADGQDVDGDGLNDYCEQRLSFEFTPELYYWSYDDISREAYWAARPGGGEKVVIAYLPSYHRDHGSNTYVCSLPPPFYHPSCDGHNGDSEMILLTVYYNYETEHWVLGEAAYSAHGEYNEYTRGNKAYPPLLTYPDRKGGYPRAWVSMGKHANYATRASCNSGGVLGTDDCSANNAAVRLEWSAYWNLGSSSHPRIDCVVSRDPSYEYYGSGRQECFWTGSDFAGWVPDNVGGDRASSYGPQLTTAGF